MYLYLLSYKACKILHSYCQSNMFPWGKYSMSYLKTVINLTRIYLQGSYAFSKVNSRTFQAFLRCISSFSSILQLWQITYLYSAYCMYSMSFTLLLYHIESNVIQGSYTFSQSQIQAFLKVFSRCTYIQYILVYIVHTDIYSMTYFMSLSKRQTIQSDRDL